MNNPGYSELRNTTTPGLAWPRRESRGSSSGPHVEPEQGLYTHASESLSSAPWPSWLGLAAVWLSGLSLKDIC